MVKIKEGYVMSQREKAEFDRVNTLPRKAEGQVAYYFKPQTKYPPRVYVFIHSEIWCDRNRRPMGLFYAHPFLTRPMNKEEIEYHHFDTRLCYYQYENWDKLLYAEEQEATCLDRELPGTGTKFLEELKSFRNKYRLGSVTTVKPQKPESDEEYLSSLMNISRSMGSKEVFELLNEEQKGKNRLSVIILLRAIYKNQVLPDEEKLVITESLISRKVQLSRDRTRRNLARRIYSKNKLFALSEIRESYPGYTEEQLLADLVKGKSKLKRSKRPPVTDLRRCQLQKLAAKIERGDLNTTEYNSICCKIVMLQQAHDLRLPIPLTVTLNRVTEVYSFPWRARESVVKSFATLANTHGMTHEKLKAHHDEIIKSNYTY